jgi:hypothetical protein
MKKLSPEEAEKVLEDMKVKIEIPKAAVTQWKRNTALDMAIEALKYSEVPNSSDCISRQAALDCVTYDVEYTTESIKALPSLQPTCNQLATDCISRQAAIDALIRKMRPQDNGDGTMVIHIMSERLVEETLNDLPSAEPERNKGCKIVKGTGHYGYCACDQCGKPVHPEDLFCSKCGADFREEDT